MVECNELIAHDAYYPLRIEANGTVVVRHNRWGHGQPGKPYLLSGVKRVWEVADVIAIGSGYVVEHGPAAHPA